MIRGKGSSNEHLETLAPDYYSDMGGIEGFLKLLSLYASREDLWDKDRYQTQKTKEHIFKTLIRINRLELIPGKRTDLAYQKY